MTPCEPPNMAPGSPAVVVPETEVGEQQSQAPHYEELAGNAYGSDMQRKASKGMIPESSVQTTQVGIAAEQNVE